MVSNKKNFSFGYPVICMSLNSSNNSSGNIVHARNILDNCLVVVLEDLLLTDGWPYACAYDIWRKASDHKGSTWKGLRWVKKDCWNWIYCWCINSSFHNSSFHMRFLPFFQFKVSKYVKWLLTANLGIVGIDDRPYSTVNGTFRSS